MTRFTTEESLRDLRVPINDKGQSVSLVLFVGEEKMKVIADFFLQKRREEMAEIEVKIEGLKKDMVRFEEYEVPKLMATAYNEAIDKALDFIRNNNTQE